MSAYGLTNECRGCSHGFKALKALLTTINMYSFFMTQKRLRHLFNYRSDGVLIEKTRRGRGNLKLPGYELTGDIVKSGHIRVCIKCKRYFYHRLVYIWHRGAIPKSKHIDHINMIPSDNRIENLRLVFTEQNRVHKGKLKNNTSGFKGVSYHRTHKKWIAQIAFYKKATHLGYYLNKEDAARAYDKAALRIHGHYAVLNFPNE